MATPSGRTRGHFTARSRYTRVQVGDPARVSGGHVTFDPVRRSACHTHPLGQTFTSRRPGWGNARAADEEISRPMSFGFRPARSTGTAAATTAMDDIAITESLMEVSTGWKGRDEQIPALIAERARPSSIRK